MKNEPAETVAKRSAAPNKSLSFSKRPNGAIEKENEKVEDAGSPEPDSSYKDIISQFHAGLIVKSHMYERLRCLWGDAVLRGTRSCHENMKARCGNGYAHLDPAFKEFDNFLLHMGPRPDPQFSIDRIDNSGGYSPANCRWADKATQTRNRSNTVMLTVNGETLPLGEWADRQGESARALHARRAKGLSDYEIVFGERPVIRPFAKYWPPKNWQEFEAAVQQCRRWSNDERSALESLLFEHLQSIDRVGQCVSVPRDVDGFIVDQTAYETECKLSALYDKCRGLLSCVRRIPRNRFD